MGRAVDGGREQEPATIGRAARDRGAGGDEQGSKRSRRRRAWEQEEQKEMNRGAR